MSEKKEHYEYSALPLTPNVAESLILELFSDRTAERRHIVKSVVQLHKSRGGGESRAADVARTVKKALEKLKKSGQATNPSTGFWSISVSGAPHSSIDKLEAPQLTSIVTTTLSAERTIGAGSSAIYVYYFETYRAHAANKDASCWPCKIGRSDRDPMLRVLSQASTALPETPTVALLIYTDDSSKLETALHSILTVRGKKRVEAPGSEWFDTTPEEVMQILAFLRPDVYSEATSLTRGAH